MAIANVQIKSGVADDTSSISITPDSNVTAGNLLIVYAMKYSPSDADVFVTGDLTKTAGTSTIGTVALDVQNLWDSGSDGVMAGMYSVPVTGTGSLTLQLTGDSGCWFFVVVQEVSGADTSGTRLAGSNSAPDTSSPYDSGTVALTGGGIFATCLATYSLFALTFTPDAAFTLAAEQESADHMTGAAAYRIVTTDTTDSGTFTSSASDDGVIVLAVYKESSGAATLTISVSQNVTVSEGVTVQIVTGDITVGKSESVTVTDTPTASLPNALAVEVADGISIGESIDVALEGAPADLTVSVIDMVYVIEPTFVGFETPAISVSESVSVSENRTVSLPNALAISRSESITVSESVSIASAVLAIGRAENVTVTDTGAAVLPDALAVSKSESVTISENVSVSISALAAGSTETVTVTDAGAVSSPVSAVSVADGVTVSESKAISLPDALEVNGNESVTVTDMSGILAGGSPSLNLFVTENVTLSESASELFGCAVFVAETITTAENYAGITSMGQIWVTDAVTLTDIYIVGMNYTAQVSEILLVQDHVNLLAVTPSTEWSRFNRRWQRDRKNYIKTGR